jgi:putative effector of murein hydrolase
MSVSQSLGGIPAIAAAIVVVVGVLGALIGFPLLKLFGVTDPEAQGIAMGSAAHAVGTAAAAEQGITQGAFSSLAMVVCGILTALIAPLLFALYGLLN